MKTIEDEYAERGLVLRAVAGGYRFATSPAVRPYVEAYLLPPKTTLSPAALETLAIVAYVQPCTRAAIEAIRGVSVESVLRTLSDRRFISETERRELAGAPLEYTTTPEFLEAFGLRSLAELPPVELEQTESPDVQTSLLGELLEPPVATTDVARSTATAADDTPAAAPAYQHA